MSDVSRILTAAQNGDKAAASQLLPLVYDELRKLAAAKMAQESSDHTLQATALVHDAYLRLVDVEKAQHWNSRGHFFGAAAEAMRRILVDYARRKKAEKRGGDHQRVELENVPLAQIAPDDLIQLDETLEQLADEDSLGAKFVELRCFAGLSVEEAAAAMQISAATAYGHWAFARAWLHSQMESPGGTSSKNEKK